MTAKRRSWRWLLLVLVLLGPQGCIIPTGGGPPRPSGPEKIAFIHPGVTTRSEVLATLGPPEAVTNDGRIIGYDWEGRQWGGAFLGLDARDWGAPIWAILVEFDQSDVVVKAEAIKTSLVTAGYLEWAEARGKLPQPPAQFVARPIPSGHAVVYLYRPSGWLPAHWVEVYLDGRPLTALPRGEYISAVVSVPPGSHIIKLHVHDTVRRHFFQFDLQVEPDSARYLEVIRAAIPPNPPRIQERTKAEAMPEISRLKGAKCFCW